jgi:hypothetical protein
MSLYSHCQPPFGTSKGTRSIHTSWLTPLCLGLIQFLQSTVNEHKYGLQNDVDDNNVGNTATADVVITINDNAVPLVMATMRGMPKAIALMATTTILLTTGPANVTNSWTMTTNHDGSNNAENGDDGEDSLPPPMMATTAEMTMEAMGGDGVWRGNVTTSWTRGTRGV